MFKGRYSTKNEEEVYTKHEIENSDFDMVLNAVYDERASDEQMDLEHLCPRFFDNSSGSWVQIKSGSNYEKLANKWNSFFGG